MNIFITGSDINVGKTFITAALAALMQSLGYKTGVFKPFQCGAIEKNGFFMAPDLAYVKQVDAFVETASSYLMKTIAAPIISAEADKININLKTILRDYKLLNDKCELVITEGTGGLCVPVAPNILISDIAKALNLPLIIITKPNTGAINHTLLTINHAQQQGLDVRGVIINKYPQGTDNISIRTAPRLIEEYSDTKVIGIVKDIENAQFLTPSAMIDIILNSVDVEKIFKVTIPKLSMGV